MRRITHELTRVVRAMSPLDRVSLVRHCAVGAAALTAYLMRHDLHAGNPVLWILWPALFLNLGTMLLSERPRWEAAARFASPLFGLLSWTALVFLTGGFLSPFVAGFGLEILLSSVIFSPIATSMITGGSVAGLWIPELLPDSAPVGPRLAIQTGFLICSGILVAFVARRWATSHENLTTRLADLQLRLRALEENLEDSRHLGRIGERTAHLAHSLKNVVHSIRGFTGMIEPRLAGTPEDRRVLDGLRAGIDRLEETARSLLLSRSPESEPKGRASAADVARVMVAVFSEVGRDYPGVRWVATGQDQGLMIDVSPQVLHEVLTLVTQNAFEAVGEAGEIVATVAREENSLRIGVRDNGPGLTAAAREKLFSPGSTTKPSGSGFGLFLARRLVESRGGSLVAESGSSGGATFTARFPIWKG